MLDAQAAKLAGFLTNILSADMRGLSEQPRSRILPKDQTTKGRNTCGAFSQKSLLILNQSRIVMNFGWCKVSTITISTAKRCTALFLYQTTILVASSHLEKKQSWKCTTRNYQPRNTKQGFIKGKSSKKFFETNCLPLDKLISDDMAK